MKTNYQSAMRMLVIAGRDEEDATEAFMYLVGHTEPVLHVSLSSRRAGAI